MGNLLDLSGPRRLGAAEGRVSLCGCPPRG